MKEYRNRWFVLGQSHQRHAPLLTLALDRIVAFNEDREEVYRENGTIDLSTYYDDVIGVTKTPGQPGCEVIFRMKHEDAPYLITKPLHATQKVLSEDADGKLFSIRVVLNFELERELLGFGARIQVLGPRLLRKRISQQLMEALAHYSHL